MTSAVVPETLKGTQVSIIVVSLWPSSGYNSVKFSFILVLATSPESQFCTVCCIVYCKNKFSLSMIDRRIGAVNHPKIMNLKSITRNEQSKHLSNTDRPSKIYHHPSITPTISNQRNFLHKYQIRLLNIEPTIVITCILWSLFLLLYSS